MNTEGILFLAVAFLGLILNFASRPVSEKTKFSQLKIKITALIIVVAAISLLFIFDK